MSFSADLSALKRSACLRDVFSLPLPQKVATLSPDFRRFETPGGLARREFALRDGNQIVFWENAADAFAAASADALDRALSFDRVYFPSTHTHATPWTAETRRQGATIDPSDTVPHNDLAGHPSHRIYFAASETPTAVVPHDATIRLIDAAMPGLLDRAIDAETTSAFESLHYTLADEFRAAAQPVDAMALHVMSGATVHFRPPETLPGRVFFRAIAQG